MLTLRPLPHLIPIAYCFYVSAAVAQEQQTVTVSASKEAVVKKIDKTVHDVSNSTRAANGTVQDVLQALPQVSVSADGKVAVNGNSQVTVLLDGKPSAQMSGEERAVALQTMSGADIASVEVITNPSAAYNANGGAIINIVLKKDRKPGGHAQLRGSATDQGLRNAVLSADYTMGALSLHGSVADRRDGNLKTRQSSVEWSNPTNGEVNQTQQSSTVFVRRHVETATLGIDIAFSDTESMSLSGRYNARRSVPLFDVLNENMNGKATTIFHRVSLGPNQQNDSQLNWSYAHQSQETVFKATMQRSATLGLIDKSYRDLYLQPVLPTDYSRGASHTARYLSQASFDWGGRSNFGPWGFGIDLQEKHDQLRNYQAMLDPLTMRETVAQTTSNAYGIKTQSQASYFTQRFTQEDWEVLLGARVEGITFEMSPHALGMQQSRRLSFNPSFHSQYTLNDLSTLNFSFRRSLQMPDPRDLNPFTTYIDAQNLSRGNPLLKPQTVDVWELGPDFSFDKLNASVSTVYRNTSNTVIDSRSVVNNILITSRENGGRGHALGLNTSLDWKPNKQFQIGVDAGVFQVSLETVDDKIFTHQKQSNSYVNLRSSYQIDGDNFSLDAHWQSKGITPLGQFGATSNLNFSWKHALSKTLSLTLNANDIFDGSLRTYQTNTQRFRQTGFDHFVARRFYIGFVKKFD